jgi:hypothetical protein
MKRHRPQENTALVLALALGLAAAVAALAFVEGVFAKLSPEVQAALPVFAAGYAVATYLCDPQVRALVNRLLAKRERRDLARPRPQPESRVPALEVRARGALDGQAQPPVRRAAHDDVRRGEAVAR